MTWFLLSLVSLVSIGLISFINKIFAERKYDQFFAANVYYGICFLFTLIYFIAAGETFVIDTKMIALSSFFGIRMYCYSLVLMTALRYLPTSTYLISVRLSSSIILLLIGIFVFGDNISLKEWGGMVFGIIAMSLLFEKVGDFNINYRKGILYFLLGLGLLVVGHTVTKILSDYSENIMGVMLIAYWAAFLVSFIIGYKRIAPNLKYLKPIVGINIIQAILGILYLVILFKVYHLGDLGISYKIQSYSPFIAILLSMIIYKEKIDRKKQIGFIFTILSLMFFI